MARFSKPAETQFLFDLMKPALEHLEKIKRDRKSPINHVECIITAFQLLQYSMFTDLKALVDTVPEFLDQIPFHGNKILKTDVVKDVEWYQGLFALSAAIKEFIIENCPKIIQWYGTEDPSGAQAYFASLTTADKLNDFSILEGGSINGVATAQASVTPATS